ncbi:glyoxalase superfamily protein [Undibacterium fentianense]|uniref:Bleomycin resistance protein n=1 Tax=Undibacterium fentianense TaxID=2828728 RepID=A0A941ICT8_9BURK|nr:glyoxalase superfamily protein [Undibacterium fentianense]MBR7800554.1 VOC family protein [Undibacterium fentianense]
MEFQTIPILRIFDEDKAKEFYLDFLGMQLDWEHRFEAGMPIYMQVSNGEFVLHLSEHSGDCTPGSKIFVRVKHFEKWFEAINARPYKYNRPTIEMASWGDRTFTVTDPFSNRLLFNETKEM